MKTEFLIGTIVLALCVSVCFHGNAVPGRHPVASGNVQEGGNVNPASTEKGDEPPLSPEDWCDLVGYAFAARGYELTLGPISRLVGRALAASDVDSALESRQRSLLVARVMQKHAWPKAACIAGYSGKGQAMSAMREVLQRLVIEYGDAQVRVSNARIEL